MKLLGMETGFKKLERYSSKQLRTWGIFAEGYEMRGEEDAASIQSRLAKREPEQIEVDNSDRGTLYLQYLQTKSMIIDWEGCPIIVHLNLKIRERPLDSHFLYWIWTMSAAWRLPIESPGPDKRDRGGE